MTDDKKLILVTGATGKVGRAFIRQFLEDARFRNFKVRALCHSLVLEGHERLELVNGSIQDRKVVDHAVAGVTHVLHPIHGA